MVARDHPINKNMSVQARINSKKRGRENEDSFRFNIRSPWGGELSNFFQDDVDVNGRKYPGGEQCFQGEKFYAVATSDKTLRPKEKAKMLEYAARFLTVTDPRVAKRMGGRKGFPLTDAQLAGWNDGLAEGVQVKICECKLKTNACVRKVLFSTGQRQLLHQDNRAQRGSIWGGRISKETGECIGMNKLGKIWMQVRDTNQIPTPPEQTE